jgi:signal transduction histidine kinase
VFRDFGTGIPADRLSKVMDPFYTTKPSGQGTGLGLSISHGILKDHGGALKIDSIEGSHTAVAIELPVSEKEVV